MRILYVTDALASWGGLERVLIGKANFFATHSNHEVYLVTVSQGSHSSPFSLESLVTHVDLNIPFHSQYMHSGLRRILFLRHLHQKCSARFLAQIDTIRPDVIICVRIEFVKDLIRVKGKIPLVFESHASFWTSRFEGAGWLRCIHTFLMNLSARKANAIVALTEGDASVWRKVNKSVFVIPDMVHLNESGTYCDGLSKTVVFVGRLSRQKDLGSLLSIWHIVHERYPDWQLHIYGEKCDADEALYKQLLILDQGMVVHSPTQNILDEYKKHTILILTSRYEPFGMVLPEAMSCGLPVVAFDCPYGPKDIVTDSVDGFLIRNRSVSNFADRICLLIKNEALRIKMGKTAIQSSQRYSADKIMPMWNHLLTHIESRKYSTSCLVDIFCSIC